MTIEVGLGGLSLSEARLARGLTLEDAERSTRIARKFLIALEEHDYSVFPAPVYARGFLRTYCRYLGLDPEVQLAELPAGWSSQTPTTHLPPVAHPFTLNKGWLFAGALVAAVIIGGFLISQLGSGGLGDLDGLQEGQGQGQQQVGILPSGTGNGNSTGSTTGRTLDAVQPGVLPNFDGVSIESATAYLEEEDLDYQLIDTVDSTTPADVIISQNPAPGGATSGVDRLLLAVSVGSTPTTSLRPDCAALAGATRISNAEQTYLEDRCTAPPASADRTDCDEIRGTNYRSPAEREFFLDNCVTP